MADYENTTSVLIASAQCQDQWKHRGSGKGVCNLYGTTRYPHIVYGSPDNVTEYKGARDHASLLAFAKAHVGQPGSDGTPCDPDAPNTTAPLGFELMPEQGWWANYTRVSRDSNGSVAQCAAACEEHGMECAGFHVWKPCVIGDCYVFLGGLESFSAHDGAFAYRRPEHEITI